MGSTVLTAATSSTLFVESNEGIRFAYRRIGKQSDVPVVLNIHFRGNMDLWDPLLVDTLAKERDVILFDNTGVGRSTGEVPTTFAGWARGLITFVQALGLEKVDLLGFSMGGMSVLEAALAAPQLVRKFIIAGSKASVRSHNNQTRDLYSRKMQAIRNTKAGQVAFDAYWKRLGERSAEAPRLDLLPMDKGGNNQVASVMDYDVPRVGSSFDRLGELKMPVLVANGDDDTLVPTSRSWELLKMIDNAQLIICPKSGHGFIWHYAQRFGEDVNRFLSGTDFE